MQFGWLTNNINDLLLGMLSGFGPCLAVRKATYELYQLSQSGPGSWSSCTDMNVGSNHGAVSCLCWEYEVSLPHIASREVPCHVYPHVGGLCMSLLVCIISCLQSSLRLHSWQQVKWWLGYWTCWSFLKSTLKWTLIILLPCRCDAMSVETRKSQSK